MVLADGITSIADAERRNVEIKARAGDLSNVAERAEMVADLGPIGFYHEDTYFDCPEGRLKLRKFSGSDGELIFYLRAGSATARESRYRIVPTSDPDGMIKTMSERHGILGQVRKIRTLFLVESNTRIHLDEVDGLGNFVEIEVILSEDETVEQGVTAVARLMKHLGVRKKDLIGESYIDLLGGRGAGRMN